MTDVARLSGTSATTVSHVVNKTRRVSPDTERAVLRAIAETGYVPDSVVRSMRTVGQRIVGLAMSAISNLYFGDVVHSIEQTLSAAGYSLLLADTHDDPTVELRAVSELLSRGVDAVILAPSAQPGRVLEYIARREIPLVVIDRSVEKAVDQVFTESVESTAALVEHLVGLGHTRLGMVSGKAGLTTTDERITGFRTGVSRGGATLCPDLVRSGDSNEASAMRAFEQLMSLEDPPTGLVVGNNSMTIGCLRMAQRMNLRIPNDVALVCFDDFVWADLFHPGLTAMAQPTGALGKAAAGMALSRLQDPLLPGRRVVLNTTFVHRESCGCLEPTARPPDVSCSAHKEAI